MGGTPLSPQEIRSCVYRGRLNDLLQDLNSDENWRAIWGPLHSRAKDQEVILRVLALRDNFRNYTRPLNQFLNDYMAQHLNPSENWIKERRKQFKATMRIVADFVTTEPFRRGSGLNIAITEAIIIGIWSRMEQRPIKTPSELRDMAITLRDKEEFVSVTDRATTQPASVTGRIRQAIKVFSGVK